MRPIRLEIEGFTSFRQKAVIDFSTLDLFAITGPTGAGKTSVIDAITYALYGCTPRIGNKAIKELISQGSDRVKVFLEFSSGRGRYRIARETKWNGKSSVTNIRFEEKEGEKWLPQADKVGQADPLVVDIIGLDFNGFTKSVVLPQGRFDEFLKGKADERRKILSDLLQLDVYSHMMQRANEIAKENRSKADTLDGLLKRDYADSTPERLTRLQQELEDLKPALEPLTQELGRLRELIPVAHQLRRALKEIASTEVELKTLGPQRLSVQKRLANAQKMIDASQRKIEVVDCRIKATAYDSSLRDDLVAKLHKSEHLAKVEKRKRELEDGQKSKSRELADLEAASKKAVAAHAAAVKSRDIVQKQLDEDRKTQEAALRKYGSADAIKALIETNKRRLKDQEKKAKLEKELARLTEDQKARVKRVAEGSEQLAAAQSALERTRAELELLTQKHMAEELKRLLEGGKPCPVCEQPVKRVPKTERHPSVDQARKALARCEKEFNSLTTTKSNIQVEIDLLGPQLVGKRREIKEVETTIGEAALDIRSVLKKNPGPEAAAELETLRQQILAQHTKVEAANSTLNNARGAESVAKASVDAINGQLIAMRSDAARDSEEVQRLQGESKMLRKMLEKFTDVSSVKAELKKQDEAKRALEADLKLKENEIITLSNAKDELAEASRVLEGLKVKFEGMERLSANLRKSIKTLKDSIVLEVPHINMDAEGMEQDPAAQLDRRAHKLQAQREEMQKKVLQCEEGIKVLNVQIERAVELRTEMEKRRAEAAVAHDLAVALRGDQFIAFIQQEAYHRLAVDGSRHLKILSSDRYSFGFEKDEFVVLDHWNADDQRPVTTLSGGESFLASLALALGLAEGLSGLSHGHGRFALESLFLDEGFGTLDAETLDVVLQGVENLSTTDRLVGIVSHIPELADRMPSRIQIRKTPGGSTLEVKM